MKDRVRIIRCLFALFKETHSPGRACIIISENLKMDPDDVRRALADEIKDCSPVKSLGTVRQKREGRRG